MATHISSVATIFSNVKPSNWRRDKPHGHEYPSSRDGSVDASALSGGEASGEGSLSNIIAGLEAERLDAHQAASPVKPRQNADGEQELRRDRRLHWLRKRFEAVPGAKRAEKEEKWTEERDEVRRAEIHGMLGSERALELLRYRTWACTAYPGDLTITECIDGMKKGTDHWKALEGRDLRLVYDKLIHPNL